MITYRRFGQLEDEDLAPALRQAMISVSTKFRDRDVYSYDEFEQAFPDTGPRDRRNVREMFTACSNLCLTVRRKEG